MKIFKSALLAAGAAASLGIVAAPAASQQNTTGMPSVPIEVWALRDVVNAVQVSPDGKHVLVHVVESKEGEYLLKIYKTEDMSKPYRVLNADPMEIISAQWVSDRYIFGSAWQQNRSRVNGPEEGTYDYAGYAYDLKANKFSKIDGNFGVANVLPNEPDSILVETGTAIPNTSGVDPYAAFRPRSYYKVNLAKGTKQLVLKGSEKYPTARFDNEGNPRWTVGYDRASKEAITYYRKPGENSWTEFMRYDQDEHENLYRTLSGFMRLHGFDPANPSIGYVIDNRGEDKAALWEFNFDTGQFGEKLAATDSADIMGIRTSSMPGDDTLVGAIYPWDKYRTIWFDEGEKALYDALEAQIPNAHQVSITSRSTDGGTMIVSNRGPRDPGSYWLVNNGTMTKLGSRNPLIQPEQLADVEFIRYPSRDGKLTIPAYFMRPKGEGPYPLIVRHNGGPHVNNVVGYDEWDQMLVNAGYAVLRPQNRISTGWGQKHFDAGYGEHGLAMQDDKDDGALYLIEKGLVDPDRVAFMGWSYGGYSALVAASRSPNVYQCVIAGAAVSDPEKSYKQRRNPYGAKAIDEWAQRRGMIGINPIKEVSKVNIPILMVHGDVDARVLYFHYEDYKDAIEKAGIQNAQFLTLKGADHFSNTLMFEHQQQFYTKMFDFLKNDCGPGGL
ncbi:prolyl oligopeptidase family serine peptidase [Erythrobacter aquimaris]|uniref:Prolyl oligopeptidase family serine peptidase n=1 Tax=Qipengyuania aquimaris TaxID=255984 RepID=A0A6I4TP79_9SPHN|nr:prolyl oligopeptidase family serine peptidase [Qipengyuania aquimaris]MXO96313.1 prolyl oligopeptidase family serine peptidase [Qipengyuania aquimaris]